MASLRIGPHSAHHGAGRLNPNRARDRVRIVLAARVHLDARRHGDAVPIPADDVDPTVHPRIRGERTPAHRAFEAGLADLAVLDARVPPRVVVAIVEPLLVALLRSNGGARKNPFVNSEEGGEA